MSAEKIIEQIKKDSKKEVSQILSEAERQAKNIKNTSKKEAETEAKKTLENGKLQSENTKKILVSKVNQDVKRDLMNAREKIIDDCFTKAQHKLSILKGADYEKLVRKLMKDGQKKLGGSCTVLVSRDADKKIAGDLGLNVVGNVESSGGVVLTSSDGRVTLDHTFDGILKREKDKIRIKVGKLLFS